jgi:NAD(P)-dependent dehydrogenase (short-subunit alcohol dehydrogenase family)
MATALITGTSTGIGYATALELARAGHTVVATLRNPERSPELRNVAERESLPIIILAMDVTSDDSVANAFAEAERRCGPIEVLVNNAGIATVGAIEDLSIDQFRESMETNFFGALRCIKAVLPGMRERRGGCIINVTSVAGRIASAAQAAYCSTKFALEAVSEVLAQEGGVFGIRVAVVEPGVIATPIFGKGEGELAPSLYPGARRLGAFFAASLSMIQIPPSVVGQKIREIVDSGTTVLRHPIGPDAAPLLARRQSMTDEQWIASGSIPDDDVWAAGIQQALGIDMRQYLGKPLRGIVTGSATEKV